MKSKKINNYGDDFYIVIPAYNEESRLPELIKTLKRRKVSLGKVIVVDDGSRKKIEEYLPNEVLVARHKVNLGKGIALRTGSELAIRMGAQTVILMDADGQHDPKELSVILRGLKSNKVVFGARRISKKMPAWRMLGNRFLNRVTAYLFNLNLSDVWCGYRGFKAEIYELIRWESSDYSVDVEMAIHVGMHKIKHKEVMIGTIYHDKGSVTGTSILDGIKLLAELFIWKLTKR